MRVTAGTAEIGRKVLREQDKRKNRRRASSLSSSEDTNMRSS